MSQPIKNPMFGQYTPRSSGDVQTGEFQQVRGGGRAASIYSGSLAGAGVAGAPGAVAAGANVYFFSGAGRLNSIIPHVGLVSGNAVTFYDSALSASGGPIPTSGHKIIARLPATNEYFGASLNSGQLSPVTIINVDTPFQSGLAAFVPSGCCGFTVTYTPEVSNAFPNP